MTNKIPEIIVKQEIKRIGSNNPYLNDVVCCIGGFETDTNSLVPAFYSNLADAEADLYDGSEAITPAANLALRQIFSKDIAGCLVVNVSTKSGSGDNVTWQRNVTKTKLENALASVKQMSFGELFVAEEITDELLSVIAIEAESRFTDKRPFGFVCAGTRNTATAYTNTAGKMGDWCNAFLTQPLIINGVELSLIESGAWLTNLIARLPIGNSLTAKVLEDVTGLGTSYNFNEGELGHTLVGLGFFVVRLIDPLNKTYECVNSAGANGLDLYINRTRDYIVNDFALRKFLGEHNDNITLDAIKMECNRLLTKFRDNLGVVEDIKYAVEKAGTNTVNVVLNTIQFADIITEIDVFITIEVV